MKDLIFWDFLEIILFYPWGYYPLVQTTICSIMSIIDWVLFCHIFVKRSEVLMKRVQLILAFIIMMGMALFSSRSASAQYWGYGYYYSPNSFNCLTGCGTEAKAAAWTSIGLSALDAALGVHMYSKQLEQQTNQNIYQIENYKSQVNINQTLVDYQNIMKVAPFFDDDIPYNVPPIKKYPTVAPLNPQKTETTSPK